MEPQWEDPTTRHPAKSKWIITQLDKSSLCTCWAQTYCNQSHLIVRLVIGLKKKTTFNWTYWYPWTDQCYTLSMSVITFIYPLLVSFHSLFFSFCLLATWQKCFGVQVSASGICGGKKWCFQVTRDPSCCTGK